MRVRQNVRIVSVALINAMVANNDGRREILVLDIGAWAEIFRTQFLRKLRRRGLCGVKLVVSDAHEGIKAAARRRPVGNAAASTSCAMRSPMQGKSGRRRVSVFIATALAHDD